MWGYYSRARFFGFGFDDYDDRSFHGRTALKSASAVRREKVAIAKFDALRQDVEADPGNSTQKEVSFLQYPRKTICFKSTVSHPLFLFSKTNHFRQTWHRVANP